MGIYWAGGPLSNMVLVVGKVKSLYEIYFFCSYWKAFSSRFDPSRRGIVFSIKVLGNTPPQLKFLFWILRGQPRHPNTTLYIFGGPTNIYCLCDKYITDRLNESFINHANVHHGSSVVSMSQIDNILQLKENNP